MSQDKVKGKVYKDKVSVEAAARLFNRNHKGEGEYKPFNITEGENAGKFGIEFVGPEPVKRGTASWKPGNTFDIPEEMKESGFRYKFANPNKPGRIQKLRAEGWEIDYELKKKGFYNGGVDDGKQIDGATYVGDLVAMKITEDKARAREEYHRNLTRERTEGAVTSIHDDGAVQTYIPKGQESILTIKH